jgi:peptidoglycan-associated lipoprotein
MIFAGLTMAVLLATPGRAAGQNIDIGAGYTYVHANLPPGGCGCFSLNGGNAWAAFNLNRGFAVLGEVSAQHGSNVAGTGADLTLTSYLFGARYTVHRFGRLKPFAQGLLGGAHASGSLAPGSSGLPGTPNAFAATAGGGLDWRLSEHFSLRAIEADYYFTHFNNSVNGRQNNFRIGAGIIFHFGGR